VDRVRRRLKKLRRRGGQSRRAASLEG